MRPAGQHVRGTAGEEVAAGVVDGAFNLHGGSSMVRIRHCLPAVHAKNLEGPERTARVSV